MEDFLKTTMGMTDEDIARISPNVMKFFAVAPTLMSKKIVAKCVKSKYCGAGIKEGDEVVFVGDIINQQEHLFRLLPMPSLMISFRASSLDF